MQVEVEVEVGAEVKRTGQEAWRARLFLREMKVSGAGGTRAVGEMKARRDAETLTVNGLGASGEVDGAKVVPSLAGSSRSG